MRMSRLSDELKSAVLKLLRGVWRLFSPFLLPLLRRVERSEWTKEQKHAAASALLDARPNLNSATLVYFGVSTRGDDSAEIGTFTTTDGRRTTKLGVSGDTEKLVQDLIQVFGKKSLKTLELEGEQELMVCYTLTHSQLLRLKDGQL